VSNAAQRRPQRADRCPTTASGATPTKMVFADSSLRMNGF
jgi:hypothetical protein